MLILEECRLVMSKENSVVLICVYAGINKIGDKGCEHLSKASWPLLENINLGN
jgi:hypothetical protein